MDTISSLANQITYLSKRLDAKIQVALMESSGSSDSPDASILCSLLKTAISEGQEDIIVAMLAALQTLVRRVSAGGSTLGEREATEVQLLLWKLISSPDLSVSAEVQRESCNVLKAGLQVLYRTAEEKNALLMLLLSEGHSSPGMRQLLDALFPYLAEELMNSEPGGLSMGTLVHALYVFILCKAIFLGWQMQGLGAAKQIRCCCDSWSGFCSDDSHNL